MTDINLQLYNHIKDNSLFESDIKNNFSLKIILPNDSPLLQSFIACDVDFKKINEVDKGEFVLSYSNSNIIKLLSPILFSVMNTNDTISQSSEIVKMYIKLLIRFNDKVNSKIMLYYYYKSRYNFLKDDGIVTALRLITFNPEYTVIKSLLDFCITIPYDEIYNSVIKRTELSFTGNNIVDILAFLIDDLYKNEIVNVSSQLMQEYLIILYNRGVYKNVLSGSFKKTDDNAITPSKHHASSPGYEISIIKEVNKINKSVITYTTGLIITPPSGYYFELVPLLKTSSNIKLDNAITIVDSQHECKITLSSVDGKPLNVTLPLSCAQLILKKHCHFILKNDQNSTQHEHEHTH